MISLFKLLWTTETIFIFTLNMPKQPTTGQIVNFCYFPLKLDISTQQHTILADLTNLVKIWPKIRKSWIFLYHQLRPINSFPGSGHSYT